MISFAHTLPHADLDRLTVIGFSMGGISNVYATMRDDLIRTLVGLDGPFVFKRQEPEATRLPASVLSAQSKAASG